MRWLVPLAIGLLLGVGVGHGLGRRQASSELAMREQEIKDKDKQLADLPKARALFEKQNLYIEALKSELNKRSAAAESPR